MKRISHVVPLAVASAAALAAVVGPVSAAHAAPADASQHASSVAAPAAYPSSKILDDAGDDQDNYYYCGPASVRNVLWAHGHVMSYQSKLAQELGTEVNKETDSVARVTPVLNKHLNTSWYESKYIKNSSSATSAETALLKRDILLDASKNYAIVANIWGTAKDKNGNSHSYPDGHYIDVTGYKDGGQTAYIYDVANGTHYYMDVHALATWIAGKGYSA